MDLHFLPLQNESMDHTSALSQTDVLQDVVLQDMNRPPTETDFGNSRIIQSY